MTKKGKRVFCFQLQQDGNYQESTVSQVLKGLPIALLVETIKRLETEINSSAEIG